METITSRQNSLLVEVGKLSQRKCRENTETFRFDGVKLAGEAIRNGVSLHALLFRASTVAAVMGKIQEIAGTKSWPACRCVALPDDLFERLSDESAPEGVIAVARFQTGMHIRWSENAEAVMDLPVAPGERILLLEAVRDPSNLGAIIRSAAAFGVDRLIMSEDCADIYSAKTVRASMGTLFSQPIVRVSSLLPVIGQLRRKDRRVFAAALREDSLVLGSFPVRRGDCMVIGNEGHGLQADTIAACDASVRIPMTPRAESLNAAVAASVLMWAFRSETLE